MATMRETLVQNVRWYTYNAQTDEESTVIIAESMSKAELLDKLKRQVFTVPEVGQWEELDLCYDVVGDKVFISIQNNTSDVAEEHFGAALDAEAVAASVRHDIDVVAKCTDAILRGKVKTQEEYLNKTEDGTLDL